MNMRIYNLKMRRYQNETGKEPWVYANASATLKSITKIRDIASIAADSRNPEHIGYALQELYSILSTDVFEEPVFFLTEDFEYNKHAVGKFEPPESDNPVEELHRGATQLLDILSDRVDGSRNNSHLARANSSDQRRSQAVSQMRKRRANQQLVRFRRVEFPH